MSATAGATGTARTPSPAAQPAYYRQRLAWRGCGDGYSCSTLRVPLDYAAPTARLISVAVVRLPAAQPTHRIGALVINPGGPGVSGVDYARYARYLYPQRIRDRFDIVGFDPRGVGASTPVSCVSDRQLDALLQEPPVPETPAETAEVVRGTRQFVAGCVARSRELLPHVGTRDVARDMDVLRAALGEPRLTYLGKSYGTYLGAVYAELFPRRVRAMVLDGAINPVLSGGQANTDQAVGFETDLRDFLTDCVGGTDCPLGSGSVSDATAALDHLLDRIDRQPLPGSGNRTAGAGAAFGAIAYGLYSRTSWPTLRSVLRAALNGDGRPLLEMSDQFAGRDAHGHYTNLNAAYYAANCVDRPWPASLPAVAAAAAADRLVAPHFGPAIAYSSLTCAYWPVPPVAAPAPIRAVGAPPLLVLGTTHDPATPYRWAQALAGQLHSGVLLTYRGVGHTAYRKGSGCVDDAVNGYLLALRLPAAGTTCG